MHYINPDLPPIIENRSEITRIESIQQPSTLLHIERSGPVSGTVAVYGAKNAALVAIASSLLASGRSVFYNVPASEDVYTMIALLRDLGAEVSFDRVEQILIVGTSTVASYRVRPEVMKKMRASVLVMGPLLARFGRAEIALPGGCILGARPIDLHLKSFEKMGVTIEQDGDYLTAYASSKILPARIVLGYPSVGATENIMMLAASIQETTTIVNASLEPEVLNLVEILRSMGASIEIVAPATLVIKGNNLLSPIEHTVMPDRLEAGVLLLAAAMTGGTVHVSNISGSIMDVFLEKLSEMGHFVQYDPDGLGITVTGTKNPRAVSFVTGPYPGFPTDLQAPMMAAQLMAEGNSVIHETVYENRLVHVRELQKMGAQIRVEGDCAFITGVDALYGTPVIATDIRAASALMLAGLVAQGETKILGIHHWRRGYQELESKLAKLGAAVSLQVAPDIPV